MTPEAYEEVHPLSGVGIGLRHPHLKQVVEEKPRTSWFEVHAENFFKPGSAACHLLDTIRQEYPLSAHCVGLSLGSTDALDDAHLQRLKTFIARYQPALVSDHLSWSGIGGRYTPDLLPVPYTEEVLRGFCQKVDRLQEILQREVLIENPSSYLSFQSDTIPEWEFLREIAARTGCGLLLDLNNIYVNCHNHGFNAETYLQSLPIQYVKEMHLAGHAARAVAGGTLLVDEHGSPVEAEVWELYATAVARFGTIPTLIEWDNQVPTFQTLEAEAAKAETIRKQVAARRVA